MSVKVTPTLARPIEYRQDYTIMVPNSSVRTGSGGEGNRASCKAAMIGASERGVDLYDEPPCAHLDAYVAATHRPMDYVMIWFSEAQEPGNACVERVRKHLRENYTRIYSSPRNLAHVYRLKDGVVEAVRQRTK